MQLGESLDVGPDRADEARDRGTPLLDAIVKRAKDAGKLRGDFDTTDIIFCSTRSAP
jgi:hypothetical protein